MAPGWTRCCPKAGWIESACRPARVSDRSDGKIAHLDGLNLSRGWCLFEMAKHVARDDRAAQMRSLAEAHIDAALPHIAGDYMGEHWLASFALLALLARPEL